MDAPYIHQEYPKWVKVAHDGDPRQPGYVLVDNAEEHAALDSDGDGTPDGGKPRRSKRDGAVAAAVGKEA